LPFTVLSQPPFLYSAWQLEHHGAQRWTTLRSGDLMASRTFCSAGDSVPSDVVARSVARIKNRDIDIFNENTGETPHSQGLVTTTVSPELTGVWKTPTVPSHSAALAARNSSAVIDRRQCRKEADLIL
jgi:hypothetical protein